MLSERFEMRFSAEMLRQIDEWRRMQTDYPLAPKRSAGWSIWG